MPILTFGKHKDSDIRDVPQSYLEWLCDNTKEGPTQQMCNEELRSRAGKSISTKHPRDVWMGKLAELVEKMPEGLLDQTVKYKNFEIKVRVVKNG